MIWKKDRLRPTQPYFVFDTEDFYQEVYLQQGISHFYTYRFREAKELRLVPDGCIDLFFDYDDGKMRGFARGSPIAYKVETRQECHDVFGVRFMPGVQPKLLDVTMKSLFDRCVRLESVYGDDGDFLKELSGETDFYQRIRVFLDAYMKAERKREKPYGKNELALSVKQMVYDSDGKIKVSELGEHTGYSERYINKVFIEKMGFSPKTFCKIIQFQRALEFLNYGAPDKMTDAAVALGYYDQSQFIRDFTRYAGITPKSYLKLVEGKQYQTKIKDTNLLQREEKSSTDFYN